MVDLIYKNKVPAGQENLIKNRSIDDFFAGLEFDYPTLIIKDDEKKAISIISKMFFIFYDNHYYKLN